MQPSGPISLKRECEALRIPSGEKITLPAGAAVRITQALGGTFTVLSEYGGMARIDGKDADALGLEPPPAPAAPAPGEEPDLEKQIWAQLRTVFDPEVPVNVVELGLVYECKIAPLAEGGHKVDVKLSLTAPGCGMGDVLKAEARQKIQSLPGVKQAEVELVLDPPWTPAKMSEAAKLQLGML